MPNPVRNRPASYRVSSLGEVCPPRTFAEGDQNPTRKPVHKRRVAVVCTFALMVVAASLWRADTVSGDDWQPISPEELKMTSLPEAPGAPAVILYRQVDRDDGRT